MHTLRTVITAVWIVFWIYWIASAFTAKQSAKGARWNPLNRVSVLAIVLMIFFLPDAGLAVTSPVLAAIGLAVVILGLALAIWGRVHLGSNWGMPMRQREVPDLITSGPYRYVRHPIYSGLLLGAVGTSLANSYLSLIIAVLLGGYFYYAATVEERNLTASFPTQYPEYRRGTKMLIPFVI